MVACGDSLGPVDLGGRWAVTAAYGGGTISCRVKAILEFPADLTSGPGSYQEERVDCTDARVPLSIQPQSYTVLLSIENRSITFVPAPEPAPCAVLRFDGSVGSDRMAGSVATMAWACGTYLQMRGTWLASRLAG
jgi:hypothetical protein